MGQEDPYSAYRTPAQAAPAANPYGAYQSAAQPNSPDEPQGSAFMRFVKAAGSKLLAGTLNAGPTMGSGTITHELTLEGEIAKREADRRAGKPMPGMDFFSQPNQTWNETKDAMVNNTLKELGQLNPIAIDKFKQGDIAGGAGDTLANLLLIRGALKTKGLPEGGIRPMNTSEVVQPLSGYTKLTPEQLAASRQPPSVWQGAPPPGYAEAPQLSSTPIQDALADKGVTRPQAQDLYHGTSHAAATSALDEGLKPNAQNEMDAPKTFLTNSEKYARQYPSTPGERAVVVVKGNTPGIDTSMMHFTQEAEGGHIAPENIKEVRYYDAKGTLVRTVPGKSMPLSTTPIQDAVTGKSPQDIIKEYTGTPNKSTGPAQWRRFMAQKAAEQARK